MAETPALTETPPPQKQTQDPATAVAIAPDKAAKGQEPVTAAIESKPPEPSLPPPSAPPACESFGTSVQFVSNPIDAARVARQENKLMFVLHISGNFEDDKFT